MEEVTKKNHHITLWLILILLILGIAGFVGYILWNDQKEEKDADSEKAAWLKVQRFESEMQLDSLEAAISYYQWNYVHGKHANQVRMLKDRIESEKRDWYTARYSDSTETVEDFIRNHSNSFFRTAANHLLDSLSFLEATEEDTYAAYEQYLDSYSDGMYAKEAKKRMEEIDEGETTETETTDASMVIANHFQALSTLNRELLKSTIADVVTSYIGKSNLTPADVEKYMESIHAIDGRKVSFQLKNIIVSKEVKDHVPTYLVNFVLNETIVQDGKTNQMNFSGLSKVSNQGKITSLILSQI